MNTIIFYLTLGPLLNYFNIVYNPESVITCLTVILHCELSQQGRENYNFRMFTFHTQ